MIRVTDGMVERGADAILSGLVGRQPTAADWQAIGKDMGALFRRSARACLEAVLGDNTSMFCHWHITTKENPRDCAAHLHEGRVFPCQYSGSEEARRKCQDYEPLRKAERG